MDYRRDIDGLRAISVLAVVLYHAGFSFFDGGFVGVDVFFVISGWLVTSILIAELEQGTFSISHFYAKRARRLLPALLVVLVSCLPFAYLWMLPIQLKEFAQSLIASMLFVSNLFFGLQEGYFATSAETKPLIHTWSLAVEGQFYIVFPLILLMMWRIKRSRVLLILAVFAAVSLLHAQWEWGGATGAGFYFPAPRAWELCVGSICAFLSSGRPQRPSNVWSALGLAFIAIAVVAYEKGTPTPSIYTILPVLGAAMIILYSAEGTWVARILGHPTLSGIGLISYSVYLWHQPLFAFARLRSMGEPDQLLMATLAVGSLLLGWMTWRYVEVPFRRSTIPALGTGRRQLVAGLAAAVLVLSAGLLGQSENGLEWRIEKELQKFAAVRGPSQRCEFLQVERALAEPTCSNAGQASADVLIFGDSHAGVLIEEIGNQLRSDGLRFVGLGAGGCAPLVGYRRFDVDDGEKCDQFNRNVRSYVEAAHVPVVVIAARYQIGISGSRFDNKEGGVEGGRPACLDEISMPGCTWADWRRAERVLQAYGEQLLALAARTSIVIVYPIPEAGWNVPSQGLRKSQLEGGSADLTTSLAVYRERAGKISMLFDRLVFEVPRIHGARVHELFCSDLTGRCVNADAGGVYYYDNNHLSVDGAKMVAPLIVDAVKDALRDRKPIHRSTLPGG